MKTGQIRYCACGCGEPAKRFYSGDRFKSWRAYSTGHAPNERLEIRIPKMISDLAYAAGIIDGEGCIYSRVHLTKSGSISTLLQLQITMCSECVIAWFAELFGGDVFVSQPPSLKNKVRYIWQIRGRQVGPVLQALLPYLREKKQRAKLAIEMSALISANNMQKLTEPELEKRKALASQIKAFNQAAGESAVQ